MTSKLTREELLNIIETDHVQCGEAAALARQALAAMDSETVANAQLPISRERLEQLSIGHNGINLRICTYEESQQLAAFALSVIDAPPLAWTDAEELRDVEKDGCGYLFSANPITPHADQRRVIKLYRHAQPAPALPAEQHWEELCQHNPEMPIADAIIRAASWNACRAAMLQAVTLTNEGDNPTDDERIMAIEGITQPLTCGNSPLITDSEVQSIIDSHEKGWAMILPFDAMYRLAREVRMVRNGILE